MNKYLEELINEGFVEALANKLGLEMIPRITYLTEEELEENENYSSCIMAALGCRKTDEYGYVLYTESMYIIKVNNNGLCQTQQRYANLVKNNSIRKDVTKLLLMHECRHLWQHQEQFNVGKKVHTNWLLPHGMLPAERDANNWMLYFSCGKEKILAKHLKMGQESFRSRNTRKRTPMDSIDLIKAYNTSYALFVEAVWGMDPDDYIDIIDLDDLD